jgi:hypothetical protein
MTTNKYQRGKIYTIRSHLTEQIYIGSTCEPTLAKRMSGHRGSFKQFQQTGDLPKSSHIIIQFGDAYIELLENFSCNTRDELHRREGHHIRNNNCVNKVIAGRTHQEYIIDNSVRIKAYSKQYRIDNHEFNKQYRIDNAESIKVKKKQYYLDNVESLKVKKKQYYLDNVESLKVKKKQYYLENAESIKVKNKQYYLENTESIKTCKKKYYIENFESIKSKIKQYQIDNAESIKVKNKQYNLDNAESIKAYHKQHYLENAESIKVKNKQYNLENSESIKTRKSRKIYCCYCNHTFSLGTKFRHIKSKKHIKNYKEAYLECFGEVFDGIITTEDY